MKANFGGSGSWKMDGWKNIDLDTGHDLREPCSLPFKEGELTKVFCSHTLEHLTVVKAHFLLSWTHHLMQIGGIFRLVVPDCQKFAQRWLMGDTDFFDKNPYLTPHFRNADECFVQMGGSDLDPEAQSSIGHYHFWDTWTLAWALARAGFRNVAISAFGKSVDDEMCEVATMSPHGFPIRGFDNPLTESVSCYVEAVR